MPRLPLCFFNASRTAASTRMVFPGQANKEGFFAVLRGRRLIFNLKLAFQFSTRAFLRATSRQLETIFQASVTLESGGETEGTGASYSRLYFKSSAQKTFAVSRERVLFAFVSFQNICSASDNGDERYCLSPSSLSVVQFRTSIRKYLGKEDFRGYPLGN